MRIDISCGDEDEEAKQIASESSFDLDGEDESRIESMGGGDDR